MNPTLSRLLGTTVLTVLLGMPHGLTADVSSSIRQSFGEAEFQRKYEQWQQIGDDSTRLNRAREMFYHHRLSTAQVKRLASRVADEDQRVEFVISAFPYVVDPENIYDVYDAFQSFSKAFRLHDRLVASGRVAPPNGPIGVPVPEPLSEHEFAEIMTTIRQESFDPGRLSLIRVTGPGLRERISCVQLAEMMDVFSFDNHRLECAKMGVEWVWDPENLHLLYRKFNFPNHKAELTRAIEARLKPGQRRPR